jgi:hypothetical protein
VTATYLIIHRGNVTSTAWVSRSCVSNIRARRASGPTCFLAKCLQCRCFCRSTRVIHCLRHLVETWPYISPRYQPQYESPSGASLSRKVAPGFDSRVRWILASRMLGLDQPVGEQEPQQQVVMVALAQTCLVSRSRLQERSLKKMALALLYPGRCRVVVMI